MLKHNMKEIVPELLRLRKLEFLLEMECERLESLTDFPSQVVRARILELLEEAKQ